MAEILQSDQQKGIPPPGGGRTLYKTRENLEKLGFSRAFAAWLARIGWTTAAERDVNSTRRDGEYTGKTFTLGSLWLGPAIIIAWALLAITIATQIAQFDWRAPDYRPFLCRPGDTRTTNYTPVCGGRQ